MKKVLIGASVVAGFLSLSTVALAAGATVAINDTASGFVTIVSTLTSIANALIPFLFAIAVVVFIYGIIRYILARGSEEKVSARGYIIWGIVGIAVIASLFGIINLLQNAFGVSTSQLPLTPPTVQVQ
jgi:predicted membrane channel-forming protein YqfA (hemolysin III family)